MKFDQNALAKLTIPLIENRLKLTENFYAEMCADVQSDRKGVIFSPTGDLAADGLVDANGEFDLDGNSITTESTVVDDHIQANTVMDFSTWQLQDMSTEQAAVKVAQTHAQRLKRRIEEAFLTEAATTANAGNFTTAELTSDNVIDEVFGAAYQVLAEGDVDMDNLVAFISPEVNRLVNNAAIKVGTEGTSDKAFKSMYKGDIEGFKVMVSNRLPANTAIFMQKGAVTLGLPEAGYQFDYRFPTTSATTKGTANKYGLTQRLFKAKKWDSMDFAIVKATITNAA